MAVFTAAEALQMSLEIEKNGEVFYNAVAAKSADPDVKAIFGDLALQEKGHYTIFENMLERMKPARSLPSDIYDEYQVYVQAALDNALFAGPDKALSLAEQAQDQESAIRAALGFEKDTLLFFYDVRDMVSEGEQEIISDIIREEKKHLRRLARML